MGKHLEQAMPSVYTLQCLTGKVDNNNNNNNVDRFCKIWSQMTMADFIKSFTKI